MAATDRVIPTHSGAKIPVPVRLTMMRAAVQVLADQKNVRLLHIKGDMVDQRIRESPRSGTDVDVIVDPRRVDDLHDALIALGWSVYSTFENGSSFGHAQTYFHHDWGHLDVHRRFPGIRVRDDDAFDVLWNDHTEQTVAGIPCAVPSLEAQSLLYFLNAARSRSGGQDKAHALWERMDDSWRARCLELVYQLDAMVAFAAARGQLHQYRHRPEYRLWKVVSEGGTRTEEWWARVRAERRTSDRIRVALRAPLVNRDRLTHKLGRAPSNGEIVREFFVRAGQGIYEILRPRKSRR